MFSPSYYATTGSGRSYGANRTTPSKANVYSELFAVTPDTGINWSAHLEADPFCEFLLEHYHRFQKPWTWHTRTAMDDLTSSGAGCLEDGRCAVDHFQTLMNHGHPCGISHVDISVGDNGQLRQIRYHNGNSGDLRFGHRIRRHDFRTVGPLTTYGSANVTVVPEMKATGRIETVHGEIVNKLGGTLGMFSSGRKTTGDSIEFEYSNGRIPEELMVMSPLQYEMRNLDVVYTPGEFSKVIHLSERQTLDLVRADVSPDADGNKAVVMIGKDVRWDVQSEEFQSFESDFVPKQWYQVINSTWHKSNLVHTNPSNVTRSYALDYRLTGPHTYVVYSRFGSCTLHGILHEKPRPSSMYPMPRYGM